MEKKKLKKRTRKAEHFRRGRTILAWYVVGSPVSFISELASGLRTDYLLLCEGKDRQAFDVTIWVSPFVERMRDSHLYLKVSINKFTAVRIVTCTSLTFLIEIIKCLVFLFGSDLGSCFFLSFSSVSMQCLWVQNLVCSLLLTIQLDLSRTERRRC